MADQQFAFFDRFTPRYDDDRLEFARADIERSPDGRLSLLDVGCGNGSTLAFLSKGRPAVAVAGIDPSQSYIDQAREAVQGDFAVGSVLDEDDLRAHRGSHDRVVMASVLHHLVGGTRRASKANAEQAIRNCLGLLRDGGRLYVFEPLTGPRPLMAVAFWLKLLGVRVFGNRRVELGAQWINLGAPLVSYLGRSDMAALVERAGGVVVDLAVPVDRKLLGVVRRQHAGYTIERRQDPGRRGTGSTGET